MTSGRTDNSNGSANLREHALREAQVAHEKLQSIAGPLRESLAAYAKIGEQVQASFSALNAPLMQQLDAPFTAWHATLAKLTQNYAHEWSQQVSAIVANLVVPTVDMQALLPDLREITHSVFEAMAPSLDLLQKVGTRYGTARQTAEAFESAGLWLAPSMPDSLVRSVVLNHKSGRKGRILASIISRHYAQKQWQPLREAVNGWRTNPLFRGRMRVIDEALEAHARGHYTLTIPALLQLVEGISSDYLRAIHPQARFGGHTKQVVKAALEDAPVDRFGIELGFAVGSLLEFLLDELYLFQDFDAQYRALRSQKRLNRHAIHHGRQHAYATRMNSLRVFLILDLLSLLEPE